MFQSICECAVKMLASKGKPTTVFVPRRSYIKILEELDADGHRGYLLHTAYGADQLCGLWIVVRDDLPPNVDFLISELAPWEYADEHTVVV